MDKQWNGVFGVCLELAGWAGTRLNELFNVLLSDMDVSIGSDYQRPGLRSPGENLRLDTPHAALVLYA